MAKLTTRENIDIEALLDMSGGYPLDFTNASLQSFVFNATNVDIYDESSARYVGSKANRLRSFFQHESEYRSGKLLEALLDYIDAKELARHLSDDQRLAVIGRLGGTAERLVRQSPIDNLDAVEPFANEKSLAILVSSIQDSVTKNQPEAALDRLHTFLTRLLRDVCARHSISFDGATPLHSLMGSYRKFMREKSHLESEMTDRILGTSISLLEAFNHVRNNHSLAHPNNALSRVESAFVVSAVLNVVKFICAIEQYPSNAGGAREVAAPYSDDDIPF
jgi:hypothetical protein